jgi:hypothetical protein
MLAPKKVFGGQAIHLYFNNDQILVYLGAHLRVIEQYIEPKLFQDFIWETYVMDRYVYVLSKWTILFVRCANC